jgi:hypothetical protein
MPDGDGDMKTALAAKKGSDNSDNSVTVFDGDKTSHGTGRNQRT